MERNRCSRCLEIRRMLRKRKQRLDERKQHSHPIIYTVSTNITMLLTQICQQQTEIKTLMTEIDKLKRRCDKAILRNGVLLSASQNQEMKDFGVFLEEVVEAYPDPYCFQRLFLEQHTNFEKSGKNGIRWHPMIIRWCLFIRNKSVKAKAYDAIRDAGFIQLPSARTLFDYSHYTKSALGIQSDVLKKLQPLEQHFGPYLHKTGASNNPTVFEVRDMSHHLYSKLK
ncbi:LOW QUALITY PROTEIN: hypothetical protein KUTeg_015880 [Tegillarca granosa]|uniref:Uncharacterized protein n=1 Tax=Tegillarca granosa TaxID=220873 RepID=A0ABQ9EP40_TEGGR|nr:LOW QUALITY PROTEIN: hypothetical protein KUTeg_015880 [Tegillarca granosa]